MSLLLGDVAVGGELPPLSIDVTPTTVVLGALASRDWRPMHHDYKFATERNGVADIFLNTPNQAAWFERFVTDWTGPKGRLGRMTFRMRDSIFPGDTMVFSATVDAVETDDAGCGWATLNLKLSVGERVCTTCTARVAIPVSTDDNPWARRGDQWRP
jgi:acyl dehydratase